MNSKDNFTHNFNRKKNFLKNAKNSKLHVKYPIIRPHYGIKNWYKSCLTMMIANFQ